MELEQIVRRERPVTRLPYPLPSQARYVSLQIFYRTLSAISRGFTRRQVRIEELAGARILVLKPCCLGDVLFATPFVRELRRALPHAEITFAVGAHSRPAIAHSPYLDRLIDTGPIGGGRYQLRDLEAFIQRISHERFDACFVLERSAVYSAIPLLAGIPIRIGIDSGGRGFSLTTGISADPPRPESELYLDLLRAIGGQPKSPALEYVPTDAARYRIDELVNDGRIPMDRPMVILHVAGGTNPGMVLRRKRWPPHSFGELGKRVVAAGGTVILVGASEDRNVANEALAILRNVGGWGDESSHSSTPETEDRAIRPSPIESPRVVDLVGSLALDELAELARRAVVYVGNDSGPSHLAEAAGGRVVMLFGPSDPIVYGPRSSRAVALIAGLWCSPCFEHGRVAPCMNPICMPSLSVDRVWREVEDAMASWGAER